jgi:predicted TIM-barrel fold metal-dependent hydrolase
LGVKKGDKVAILLPNCLEFPYSWLAASMIVANHGGWAWMNEMVAVVWKRPNVYIEIGGISPKYIAKPGSGWGPFLTYANSLLQDQILFATDSLISHERVVKEMELLPLEDQIKEKLLYKNAMGVLNLCSS